MTQASISEIAGQAAVPISIGSLPVISPSEFAAACREIVMQHDREESHRLLDRLVTELLSSLGYGEGMAVFLQNVGQMHGVNGL